MHPIYLDFNSTAPQLAEVTAAMCDAEAAGYANPASQHSEGRRAHAALENSREEIARLLGADLTDRSPDRLIFTSGGTEANNLALFGLTGVADRQNRGRLVISAIEHPSVSSAADVSCPTRLAGRSIASGHGRNGLPRSFVGITGR